MRLRFGAKAALRCAFAAVLGLVAFSATPALAKQCVWNKAGFVLRVDWFAPEDYTVATNPTDQFNEYTFLVQPIQTDVIWAPGGGASTADRPSTTPSCRPAAPIRLSMGAGLSSIRATGPRTAGSPIAASSCPRHPRSRATSTSGAGCFSRRLAREERSRAAAHGVGVGLALPAQAPERMQR